MSDKDIPSGPENERTIIKPNPGLRRPAAPAKPARPPQPEQTPSPAPYTPVTAPAYQPRLCRRNRRRRLTGCLISGPDRSNHPGVAIRFIAHRKTGL